MERIKLTGFEASPLVDNIPCINTITYYRGVPPLDYLRKKIYDIVKLNPWLEGWLSHRVLNGRHIQFSKVPSLKCFSVIDDYHISLPDNYENGFFISDEKIAELKVKIGSRCVNRPEELLFKIMVLTSKPSPLEEPIYAIWVSMSHVIADGFTFYRIQNMLSMDKKVEAMIFDRITDFTDRVYEQPYTVKKWMLSLFLILRIIWTLIYNSLVCPKPILQIHSVCNQSINISKKSTKELKQSTKHDNVEFVSTNDIITSSFFNAMECDVGMMTVNFRNRLKDITDNHAGNYETMLVYSKEDFNTPMAIRQTLLAIDQQIVDTCRRIDVGPRVLNTKFAFITNWSTFYHEIELPNSQHLLHMPLIREGEFNSILNGPLMIIFKASKYRLVVWSQVDDPVEFEFGKSVSRSRTPSCADLHSTAPPSPISEQ